MHKSEKRTLYIRTILIAGFAPIMAWMLSRAYQPSTLLWQVLRFAGDLVAPAGATPIEFISMLLLGLYSALLGLFTLDERKRIQGLLLSAGSIIGVVVLSFLDILLPNIEYLDLFNWAGFVVGLIFGLGFGGKQLLSIVSAYDSRSQSDLSFHLAGWALFGYLCIILISSFLGAFFSGTGRLVIDLPFSAATIYLLFGFVQYTSQADVAVIGPRESGKSLLLLGLYLSFRDRGIAGSAEGYMRDLISQADSITPGEDFPIVNTYDLEELWFFITKGGLFPERIKITATDHTGELLTQLQKDLATSHGIADKLEVWQTKYKKLSPLRTFTPGGEDNYRLFEHQVRTADVVLLCVDVQRLQNGDVEFIESLQTIGNRARSNGADVLIVATKCDLLIDEFSAVVDNPMGQGLDREFQRETDQKLRERYATVDGLCDDMEADTIYAVYYQTTSDDGHRIPDVSTNGALQYQGMEGLGDALLDGLE